MDEARSLVHGRRPGKELGLAWNPVLVTVFLMVRLYPKSPCPALLGERRLSPRFAMGNTDRHCQLLHL